MYVNFSLLATFSRVKLFINVFFLKNRIEYTVIFTKRELNDKKRFILYSNQKGSVKNRILKVLLGGDLIEVQLFRCILNWCFCFIIN